MVSVVGNAGDMRGDMQVHVRGFEGNCKVHPSDCDGSPACSILVGTASPGASQTDL